MLFYKRDATGKPIPPDYMHNGQPAYLNRNVAEYEITLNGAYYGTVHVCSIKNIAERNDKEHGDKKYWRRLDRTAKERAKIIFPHMPRAAKIRFLKIID